MNILVHHVQGMNFYQFILMVLKKQIMMINVVYVLKFHFHQKVQIHVVIILYIKDV